MTLKFFRPVVLLSVIIEKKTTLGVALNIFPQLSFEHLSVFPIQSAFRLFSNKGVGLAPHGSVKR